MTRIYISGPMTGVHEHNLPLFREVEARLKAAGFNVVSPAAVEHAWGNRQSWRWYMREAIKAMAEVDCVAMLPGWDRSRGALTEREVAFGLDLPVLDWKVWVEIGPAGIKLVVDQMGGGATAPDFETERAAALALRENRK